MDRSGWDAASWVDQELAGSTFKDERLGRRLRKLLVQSQGSRRLAVGSRLALACTLYPDNVSLMIRRLARTAAWNH